MSEVTAAATGAPVPDDGARDVDAPDEAADDATVVLGVSGAAAGEGEVDGAAGERAGTVPPVRPVQYCPVELDGLDVVLPDGHARMALREVEGEGRVLVIPIGLPEANAIVVARDQLSTPRPLTHELFATALHEYGVVIETVRITAGDGRSFRAELVLSGPAGEKVLDCRPSDAVALALRQELPAPLTVAVSLLDQLGVAAG